MSTAKYNFYWVFVALFAVSLFYPFKAIAQDGPSTLTQFTTIDCPTIDVSGKDLYEKDCVQDILNQLHQSYNKEMISAEDAIRKDKEMISNEDTIRKDAEQAHLAESAALREQIKTMTTTIDQAKVAVEHMNKCMADSARQVEMLNACTAGHEQANAQLQEANAGLRVGSATVQGIMAHLASCQGQLQEANAQLQAGGANLQEKTAELASCQTQLSSQRTSAGGSGGGGGADCTRHMQSSQEWSLRYDETRQKLTDRSHDLDETSDRLGGRIMWTECRNHEGRYVGPR